MSARTKARKIVSGGPILAALAKQHDALYQLVNLSVSAVLDALEEMHRREVEHTALLERIAGVVAPTDAQQRQARMTIIEEARRFDAEASEAEERELA